MTKTYYRNEYTEKQWKALIDEAIRLGCNIVYGKYGDRVIIDSTGFENILIDGHEERRASWAEYLHGRLQKSTDLRKWRVEPKKYHRGYCPTLCKSQRSAEYEQERLERTTGFEWKIIVIKE